MLTFKVGVAHRPNSRVEHMHLSENGANLAWAQSDYKIGIISDLSDFSEINIGKPITGLIYKSDNLFILDESYGLHMYLPDNSLSWQVEIPSGGSFFSLCESFIAVVDNLGRLNIVNYSGDLQNVSNLFSSIIGLETIENNLIVIQDDGVIHLFDGEKIVWTRPNRGEMGESITCVGCSHDRNLIVGREGFALVPGEEEALEMEVWALQNGTLISRTTLRNRLLKVASNEFRTILGFDNGSVIELIDKHQPLDNQPELISCDYPINKLLLTQNNTVISGSWFYIHGLNDNNQTWIIEHQGIVRLIAFSETTQLVYFAGDDQNDYTENEPIGFFNLDAKLSPTDKAELANWFDKTTSTIPLSAKEIYSEDEKLNSFLQQSYTKQVINSTLEKNLLDALEAEIDLHQNSDELDDPLLETNPIDSNLLLNELGSELISNKSPKADAGEDMVYNSGKDNTAIILLDATRSYDPSNMIVRWSWLDHSGKEISTLARCRVKLGVGKYRFELRIIDKEGNSNTDSVIVEVI